MHYKFLEKHLYILRKINTDIHIVLETLLFGHIWSTILALLLLLNPLCILFSQTAEPVISQFSCEVAPRSTSTLSPRKGSCSLNPFCWKDRTCSRIKMSFLHWPKPCALFKEIQIKITVQKTEHFLHLWSMSQNT